MMLSTIKYPSIKRLSWSPDVRQASQLGQAMRDETHHTFVADRLSQNYIATIKYDGGNIYMDSETIHARSIDDKCDHIVYNYTKRLWSQIRYMIPSGYGIFGEDLHVTRSIQYARLPSFFIPFTVVKLVASSDGTQIPMVLSVVEQNDFCDGIGLAHAPAIWGGVITPDLENRLQRELLVDDGNMYAGDSVEGYVMRPFGEFPLSELPKVAAKFVRANHVQSEEHWKNPPYKFNKLALAQG